MHRCALITAAPELPTAVPTAALLPPLTLRVLNVMGYGFDDDRQPDAERFGMYSGESAALYAAMRSIFVKILAWCVPCNPRTALAMTVVPYHCLSYRRAINQINLCLG